MKKVIHKIASIDDQIIKAFGNQKNGRKSLFFLVFQSDLLAFVLASTLLSILLFYA